MNEPELKMDGPETDEVQELKAELESLRGLIAGALALLIVFTGCVDFYLSAQTSEVAKALAQEQQALQTFSAVSTKAGEFWIKLEEYSKTHPDFNPVLDKWKGRVTITTNVAPARPK